MAEDNNDKPNKPHGHEQSPFFEKIGQAYRTTTAKERFEEQRLKEIDDARLRKLAEQADILREGAKDAPVRLRGEIQKAINALEEKQERYSGRVEAYHEVRQERYEKLLESKARSEFEPGGSILAASKTSEAQTAAAQYTTKPYKTLEQSIRAGRQRLGELQELAAKVAPQEVSSDPSKVNEARELIPKYMSEREQIIGTLGAQVAAQRYLRTERKDPESQLESLFKAGSRAEKTLFKAGVSDRLKEGGDLSKEDTVTLKQKEIDLSRELVKALEEFKNATEETTKVEAQERAESKKKQLEETQEAMSQGGGGRGGIGRVGRFAAGAAAIVGAATQAFDNVAIGQTNLITTNRTAAASAVNDIYNRRMRTAAGDMTQLSMFERGVHEEAIQEALKSRTNKQIVNVGHTTTAGLATLAAGAGLIAAGSLASATGIGAAAGVPMIAAGVGALASSAVAGGLSNMTSSGADLVRGASANREFLDEFKRQQERGEAELYITGQQRQRLYDFGQGMRGVALAAGRGSQRDMSGGIGVMNAMEADGAVLNMVDQSGLTPEQFSQLAASAARRQGSTFNLQQVGQAADYQRAGVADIQTVMGLNTRLSQAGANNPQASFASVLELAFTKSLNSAESLTRLVEHTGVMAERSVGAAAGMQMTGAAAGTIAALVDPNIKNKEFAADRAATAAEAIRNLSTDTGASFESMLAITDVARAGRTDFATGVAVRHVGPETLNAMTAEMSKLKKMTPNSAERNTAEEELARNLRHVGLVDFTEGNKVKMDDFDRAMSAQRASIVKSKMPFLVGLDSELPGYKELMTGNVSDPDDFIKRNQQLTGQMNKYMRTDNRFKDVFAEDLIRSMGGAAAPSETGLAEANKAKAGAAPTELGKVLQEMTEQIGRATTSEAKKAAEAFGGSINKAMSSFLTQMKQNQEALQNFDAKKGEVISKDFSDGAKMFNSSVANFSTIINDFGKKYNVGGSTSVPRPSTLSDSQEKKR